MSIDAPVHPWALWQLLLTLPSWLLHRGYPPALDDPRLSVRLLRMAIVTFFLGFLAGWAYVGLRLLVGYSGLRGYVPEFIYILITCCYSGLCFGLIVLVPLSRWQGRNWWWTTAAVPVSAVVHHLLFSFLIPWVATQPSWVYDLLAGTIGGFGIALWMIPPVNLRALGFMLLTVAVGIAGRFASHNLLNNLMGNQNSSVILEHLVGYLQSANMQWPFNGLVAMVIGWELATRPRNRN